MQLDKPKFCRDCKHYLAMYLAPRTFCKSPNIPVDLVTGRHLDFPEDARKSQLKCGPDADWFEPIPAPEPKRPWWRLLCK